MKRAAAILIIVALISAGAWLGIRVMHRAQAESEGGLLATVPAPCPTQNDLAGIEGYAPGASGAEHTGQENSGLFGEMSGDTADASPAPTEAPAAWKCRALAPAVEEQFASLAQAAEQLPSSDYDADGLAQQIGTDPAALFAYVRDKIRTEPYPGIMRGPYGVLMSGGGSPADKAFLLAQLLQSQSVEVRFVHAPLSDAEIERILGAAQQSAASPPLYTPDPDESPVPASWSSELNGFVDREFEGELRSAQDATGKLLSQSGVALAANDNAVRAALAGALRDHWWLQAQIDGNWVDLDPALPGAKLGTHLGGNPADEPADDLPDSLKTTVVLRLNATYDDGHTATIASHDASTIDLYDQPVKIGFETSGKRTFTPFIDVAGTRDDAGAFTPEPQSGPKVSTVALAIEVTPPAGKPYMFQRMLFDRPRGDDAAYALRSVYFGLVVSGEVGTPVAMRQEAAAIEALHNALAFAAAQNSPAVPPGADMTYPIPAMRYLVIDQQARRQLERSTGTHFYVDRPQIVFFEHGLLHRGGHAGMMHALDVFDNRMSAIGSNGAAAIRTNVTRGYVDDDIENGIVRAFAGTETMTTAQVLAHSQGGVRAFRASDTMPVSISPSLRAIIADSIRGGVALAPAQPPTRNGEFAWWALDPSTGNMIGRMQTGAGQALVETGMQMYKNIKAEVNQVQFLGTVERCIWTAQSNQLAGQDARTAVDEEHQCLAEAGCNYYSGVILGFINGQITPSEVKYAYKIYKELLKLLHLDEGPPATKIACKNASKFF